MRSKGAYGVGRFSVQFEIANHVDVIDEQRGLLEPGKVRRMMVRGVVDSGATKLVLPGKIARQLGLPRLGKGKVRYANIQTATRETVADAHVRLLGRDGVFSAIVEPRRQSVLIGAIVLEDLDFIVDCTQQRLVPRDPRYIISEIE